MLSWLNNLEQEVEVQLTLADSHGGKTRWLGLSARPAIVDDEKRIVAAIVDISSRKEAEKRLKEISSILHYAMPGDPSKISMDLDSFRIHSMACGLLAQELARSIDYPRPGEAFTAGLFHDIGKLAMEYSLPEEYHMALTLAQKPGVTIRQGEKQIFGANHTFFSDVFLRKWNLPEPLRWAITHHHTQTEIRSSRQDPVYTLTVLVYLSDLVCKACGLGFSGDALIEGVPETVWDRIPVAVDEMVENVVRIIEKLVGQLVGLDQEVNDDLLGDGLISQSCRDREVVLYHDPKTVSLLAVCLARYKSGVIRVSSVEELLQVLGERPALPLVFDDSSANTNMQLYLSPKIDKYLSERFVAASVCTLI